ncbi:hypothetical protein [Mucilaginibacter aquatilis]|uniref:Uncharacterized protein n=1 Tax=Mucilaginibacter aquatilis TaxID=1517760 RepID=A0A6I4IBM8_9SPHI|nr:hypothetical protein [Mucilaginibacter aquatilis]MVN90956.1 hypothetical protein [Mucilaginibacter aquatilis]
MHSINQKYTEGLLYFYKLSYKTKNKTLINTFKRLFKRKPKTNDFYSRYPEKFTNPDHYQWQGGRLLTRNELEKLTGK